MDINKRFDQLESLLVDLARKQDQQAEQIAHILRILGNHGEAINSLGELLNSHTEILNSHTEILHRQERRLDDISDQIGDLINILKMSETRHTESERRQDAMMTEIKMQSQRQDVAVEALRVMLKRQDTTDSRLNGLVQTQLQMLQLMRADANKLDGQEPRIKRLEDKVFREAS